ncbi:MAG: hypothetical protein JWQ81_8661 [Amycolatopsis sp.]|uniref:prenyltransferase/squalene oxidase repeat-containing protein n=1 Tax=Amycolatopsis sp. TaxID=37632 RepID=UPI00261E6316|nr:prenyltransferase/squalene oxidase repeat-containing protein [Amycolatopsis sp.]MCU1687922.1 hypothetical protein [Amycolatopsis sp.]
MNGTAASIAAAQRSDGGIPWEAGSSLDPWNHTEAAMGLDVAGYHAEAEAAYEWLASKQNPDGSWFAEYRDGEVVNRSKDTNFSAYVAVGVTHHALIRDDDVFLRRLWPTVERAIEFVLGQQTASGEIPWRPPRPEALLSGCCSIHHALRRASAMATRLGHPRPAWDTAADRLREAIVEQPRLFTPKPHAMDWYYPVLCSVVPGVDTLDSQWDRFVVPGLGVRCVRDQPWVTGGETAELALTLAARGDRDRAAALLADIQHLRHEDGSYWTGYQFANDVLWPEERTTWTAGALLLAEAALAGEPATLTVFGES